MQNVGFLLFNDIQAMDIIAPYELFDVWQMSLVKPTLNIILISEDGNSVNCANSRIKIEVDTSFQDAPNLDYLIIPGGSGRVKQAVNSKLLEFLQKQASYSKVIASICTGAFLLYHAGLLQGRSATTYWRALEEFSALHPDISEERIVKDGKIWTAGGVSSGLDIALELIREVGGEQAAIEARLAFEYFPNPPTESLQDLAIFNNFKNYQGMDHVTTKLPQYIESILGNSK